jgi:4-amino-4-deoxy-L-arabinose transferase-like glycosyltransferase
VLAAAAVAVLARAPFLHAPLTADEGGYAEVARLWSRGATLYRGAWVDRPQGLELVFRAILHVDGGSAVAIRAVAAVVAAGVVALIMAVAARAGGRIAAVAAGGLVATAGASPFIESFTLSGELLASAAACASMLAFLAHLRRGGWGWLALAGLLTGCAVMLKQSGFDAGAAAAVYLLWTRRREAVAPVAVLVGAAVVPVAAGALAAASFHEWWYAVVSYRGQADSIVTGSVSARLHLAWDSLPAAGKGLGVLAILASAGARRAPGLILLWLGFAVAAVVGGGNFHAHYYQQLVPPLGILAGIGAARLLASPRWVWVAAAAAAAAVTVALTAPLWFDSPSAQARAVLPGDPHLRTDAAVVSYVRAHTRAGQRILVMWAAADVYYLADRDPAVRYMWFRNIQAIPGALGEARRALAGPRPPALVVEINPPGSIDASGATAHILATRYRLAATVAGVPVYAPR